MKRAKAVPSSDGKKPKTGTLLQWMKKLNTLEEKYQGKVTVEQGDRVDVVDVLFHPTMFDDAIPFGVLSGRQMDYVPESETEVYNAFMNLVAGEESKFCYRGNTYVTFYEDGKMYQKNILTHMRREIIPNPVGKGMELWAKQYGNGAHCAIRVQLVFDRDKFPDSPPFCYVKEPRIQQWSGHITLGGSFCTKLLTVGNGDGKDGAWHSTIEPDELVDQLYNCLINYGELNDNTPSPYLGALRIDMASNHPYSETSAKDSHRAACATHNWNAH